MVAFCGGKPKVNWSGRVDKDAEPATPYARRLQGLKDADAYKYRFSGLETKFDKDSKA